MVDIVTPWTFKMILKLCGSFKVTFSVLVLTAQFAFPLKISKDTLKTITRDKFYPTGCAHFKQTQHSDFSNLSQARSTGTIQLARLEYGMHSDILKKLSLVPRYDEKRFIGALLEYVEDYRTTASSLMQSGMSMEASVKSVAGNMIAVYRMVRRFRNYIQPWILQQKHRTALPFQTEVLDDINPTGKSLDLFTNDFQLSMIPIITTQFVMDWKAEDICKGTIEGMELGSTLKAVHCLELGVHAIASGMYPIGIEWIEQAVSKALNENDTSTDVQLAMDVLEKAYTKHDQRWRPRNLVHFEETFYERRLNDTLKSQDKQMERKWRKQREYPKLRDLEPEVKEIERFSQTCQGKVQQPEHIKSKLFCWLETSVHPTWKIGPLKAELISGFPHDMVLFHDVISVSLTKDVIEYCEPVLDPGILYSESFNPKTRMSSATPPIDDPTLASRLHELTERMTGLRTKQTTVHHGSSYQAGGHMNLHLDIKSNYGGPEDYIASVIFYLKAAEIGGETGFTGAQLLLKAPKRSAVFWYHLIKSGAVRKGAAHGSCPVVQGQKWVLVKFLKYSKQTHLACDRDEYSRMEYLVNGRSKYK